MKLRCYKTWWGFEGTHAAFAEEAFEDGYNGLEAPVPEDEHTRRELQSALAHHGFDLIAEICTAGSYVPDRRASVTDHIESFRVKLENSLKLSPRQINCMAGCDAWPLAQSVDFFSKLIEIAREADIPISFETHRSRILFNPWITRDLVRQVPDLYFTCDFSHWCVVCERLIDTETDALAEIFPRARHIHGRVGYDQGPQVPHPAAPEYADALAAHQRWWEACWHSLQQRGATECTMTPEFGPDGYLHQLPFTSAPVGDLRSINHWIMQTEREHFSRWHTRQS